MRQSTAHAAALIAACTLAACPETAVMPDDAAASTEDAPATMMDAWAETPDARDFDETGLDPADAWSAPDVAGPPCEPEGAMRTSACGNCGLGSQRCIDGEWTMAGPCIGEGECAVAAIESRTTDVCAEEARICNDMCRWSPWDEITPASGECTRGERRVVADGCAPGSGAVEACSDTCAWAPTGECEDPCGGTARITPVWAMERCIPAGPFMRGTEFTTRDVDEQPMREVMLSAYYIDRYPVINRRYRECVDAGVCTLPTVPEVLAQYTDPTREAFPMAGVTWEQAAEFCNWDGGRMLPTEAQWEKAARGPSPDTRIYPWGNDEDCSRVPNAACGATAPPPGMRRLVDEYDAFPTAASPFGVEGMIGMGGAWIRDWYSRSYYGAPESLVDPEGPAAEPFGGLGHVFRSYVRWREDWDVHLTDRRHLHVADWHMTFRCSRRLPP